MGFKRFTAVLLSLLLLSFSLSACNRKQANIQATDSLSVYATFFPIYALAELILQDVPNVELHCLVQPQDGCLREYQLSDWDAAILASADIVIAGGNGLESFEDALYAFGEYGPSVIAVLHDMPLYKQDAVNIYEEESESHWVGENPHIYLNMDGAIEICRRIASAMSVLDEKNKAIYSENLIAAERTLNDLRNELQSVSSNEHDAGVIVMNEALVYAATEYGVNIDMSYARESGEDLLDYELEACVKALSESDAQIVLIEKQAPQNLCRKLENEGYILARMDILSTRRADEGFQAFAQAYRQNAQALNTALKSANSQP